MERAFGVLQLKFQVIVVQKVEQLYVGDIANIVNCCICLHNVMVANRMAMGDKESEEFYAFPAMVRRSRATTATILTGRGSRESLC